MKISDMIAMCMGNLFRRKLRTLLTVTGVVVGTCSIVAMVSLMLGMNLKQEALLASMGDLTRIEVMNYSYSGDADAAVMDDKAIEFISNLPNVEVATPFYNANYLQASLYTGKAERYKAEWLQIMGVYAQAMPKMGYQLLEGDWPKPQNDKKKPIYVLIGEYTDYEFTDTKKKFDNYRWPQKDENGELTQEPFVDMMKDKLLLRSNKTDEDAPDSTVFGREIVVAGRMKEDYSKGYETSRGIIMDIEDLKWLEQQYIKVNKIKQSRTEKQSGYRRAVVKVHSLDDVDAVETAIKTLKFETQSAETTRKPMQENARQQQLFLGMMGGISLVVAAIGITNTMIMSIYERTREIGVMKVLGCKIGNIRSIFLLEAGVIGFIGGCAGVVISFLASYVLNYFNFSIGGNGDNQQIYRRGMMMGSMGGDSPDASALPASVIPLWLVVAGIVFATLIGLLAGIPPASRAVKISALEAIKHE